MGGLILGGLLFKTVGWRVLAFTGKHKFLEGDKTMDDKLFYSPNFDKQKFTTLSR